MVDEEKNINSSEEGTDATVNSPTPETDAEQSSEETQTSEEKTETPESEAEEEVNWQKRYLDTQSELTKTRQQMTDFGKTETDRAKQQDFQKYREEQQKRLDVGTYMTQYKNPDGTADVAGGLNAWMQAREDNVARNIDSRVGVVSNQTQYLQWSISRMLKQVAPEAYKEQMGLEKKIKGLYDEMPALRNAPNSISLAEEIILSKTSKKDRDTLVKDAIKQGKKSAQQEQGVSISPSKSPTKKTLSAAESWHQKIIESGRQKTVL